MWPPPRTADKTLQAHVTRLRSVLGRDTIVRMGAAYRLDLPADAVDVLRFQHRLGDGDGDVDGVLDEWIGTPRAGLDADGFTATVDRLVEQWLGATETRLTRLVATDPAATVGPLTELTAAHLFREELWAQLMTALYRMDRQGDALAAYRTARRQLGVEPGTRLREPEATILAQNDQLEPAPAATPRRRAGPATCDGRGTSGAPATPDRSRRGPMGGAGRAGDRTGGDPDRARWDR